MVKQHLRKMVVSGDHIVAPESGPPWIVLWDTAMRVDGNWSVVRAPNEANALERAAHFVKLGFVVFAIRDPSGTVVMNADDIARRFGPTEQKGPNGDSVADLRTVERMAHAILWSFVEKHQAAPGRMLAAATLHDLLAPHGVTRAEFERGVSFAKERGWLNVADGMLTLTQPGFAAATT